jgi:PleD family two-component response regulator
MRKMTSRGEDIYGIDVFEILFDYEITRTKRIPTPLAMLHIEVTPTSSNEETLKAAPAVFITALNTHLRSVDIPSSAGRDYKVLLPTTDEPGVRTVCERLLSVFKNKFDTPGGSVAFSIQIGATVCAANVVPSKENIYQKAKEALMLSKLKGSNTYVIA